MLHVVIDYHSRSHGYHDDFLNFNVTFQQESGWFAVGVSQEGRMVSADDADTGSLGGRMFLPAHHPTVPFGTGLTNETQAGSALA